MTKTALLLLGALLACSRNSTYEAPKATAGAGQAGDTWVAQPGDLSPEQVRTVQRALIDRGFAVELSGAYDAQTRTAVSDFQRSRGLPATGNLNADTVGALGVDPGDVKPVRGGAEGTTPAAPSDAPRSQPAPDDAAPTIPQGY